ncbi:MAG: hypothetical protein MJK18_15340, partial [Bdellovibrionales bacterium]|nr:hypothetical protein [Bdellovibrionales bacterium]
SEDPNLNIGNLGALHGKTVQLIGGTTGQVPGVVDGLCTDPDGCPDELVQASLGTAPDAFDKPQEPAAANSGAAGSSTNTEQ